MEVVEEEERLWEAKRGLVGEEDLEADFEGEGLVGDLAEKVEDVRGDEGDESESECMSFSSSLLLVLVFFLSLSLSFLKIWASWTIGKSWLSANLFFVQSKLNEGGRMPDEVWFGSPTRCIRLNWDIHQRVSMISEESSSGVKDC